MKTKPSLRQVEDWMSAILSKAQALSTIGLPETAQPLWASAAKYEERIASLLDAQGENLEAAVHRISAASCFQKASDPSRATSLYRAALAGPLRQVTRDEVQEMLHVCLALLAQPQAGKLIDWMMDLPKPLEGRSSERQGRRSLQRWGPSEFIGIFTNSATWSMARIPYASAD